MPFKPQDWSKLSYREVKNLLEQYRESYKLKEKDVSTSVLNATNKTK